MGRVLCTVGYQLHVFMVLGIVKRFFALANYYFFNSQVLFYRVNVDVQRIRDGALSSHSFCGRSAAGSGGVFAEFGRISRCRNYIRLFWRLHRQAALHSGGHRPTAVRGTSTDPAGRWKNLKQVLLDWNAWSEFCIRVAATTIWVEHCFARICIIYWTMSAKWKFFNFCSFMLTMFLRENKSAKVNVSTADDDNVEKEDEELSEEDSEMRMPKFVESVLTQKFVLNENRPRPVNYFRGIF